MKMAKDIKHTWARSPLYVPIFILTQVSLERSIALLSTDKTSVISFIGTSIIFVANIFRRPLTAWSRSKLINTNMRRHLKLSHSSKAKAAIMTYLPHMGFLVCFNINIVLEVIKSNNRPDLQFRSFIDVFLHEANCGLSFTTNLACINMNFVNIPWQMSQWTLTINAQKQNSKT